MTKVLPVRLTPNLKSETHVGLPLPGKVAAVTLAFGRSSSCEVELVTNK